MKSLNPAKNTHLHDNGAVASSRPKLIGMGEIHAVYVLFHSTRVFEANQSRRHNRSEYLPQ